MRIWWESEQNQQESEQNQQESEQNQQEPEQDQQESDQNQQESDKNLQEATGIGLVYKCPFIHESNDLSLETTENLTF